MPERGATIGVEIPDDVIADAIDFSAHGICGRIALRGADHADMPLRPVPPVLLFRKLVTETDILLACGLTGDVHPWHLQDVAARAAGLSARPLPSVLLMALALGAATDRRKAACRATARSSFIAPLSWAMSCASRARARARQERAAIVLGERVIADAQFDFIVAPS